MKPAEKLTITGLVLLVFALTACGGLTHSDKPAERTWWLLPYTGMSPGMPGEDALTVALSVTAIPGLDTDQILTLSSDSELNHYSGARWADNLPDLLASLTSRSLQASGRFKVVSSNHAVIDENCKLWLEVHEFFARSGPSGQRSEIRVSINGHYQCRDDVLSLIRLNASIPVEGEQMSAIVAAFQQAINHVMAELPGQMSRP
jgi:ABC-type uncharacterized transport system auxiliary subunit